MTLDPDIYLNKFDPHRDEQGWVNETPREYAGRIKRDLLPFWPEEVLIEWLHRHNSAANRYAFLGFENFRFRRECWELKDIPDRNAFLDPRFCDNFMDVERRSRQAHGDWLAKFMMENGTWNTPPIFLDNRAKSIVFPSGELFKSPYHLLEGHRRLSFLNGLREDNRAKAQHDVWVVELAGSDET